MHKGGVLGFVAIVSAATGPACQSPPPDAPRHGEQTFAHPGAGVSFVVPRDWAWRAEGDALVFAGSEGTPAYYTTITLQVSPPAVPTPAAAALEQTLEATYRSPDFDRPPRWLRRDPALLGEWPALRYLVRFVFQEHDRLRDGVLLAPTGAIIDLNYTAPVELFATSLAVYERILESLATEPVDGGAP